MYMYGEDNGCSCTVALMMMILGAAATARTFNDLCYEMEKGK